MPTVDEVFADHEARLAVLEGRVSKLRGLTARIWRKLVNRNPSDSEL